MYDISQKIINSFTSKQLEDIFIINKLKIHGFRVEGPSNPVKTKMMKTLLINNPKLELILKKTAEVNKTSRNKDHTWALVETLDLNLVKEKIEETDIGEVAYALINAEKFEILKGILVPLTKESFNNNEKEYLDQNNEPKTDSLETTVANLRDIVRNLEEKNKALNKDLIQVREEATGIKQDNATLKSKNNELKDELVKLNERHNQKTQSLDLTNEKIHTLEKDLETLELEKQSTKLEIEKLSKMKILFYGTNAYKRYIDTKVSKIKRLSYEYIYELSGIENYAFYQKLIILKFALTKLESEDLSKQNFLRHFGDLHNLIFIESFEELNEYIEMVGNYYE